MKKDTFIEKIEQIKKELSNLRAEFIDFYGDELTEPIEIYKGMRFNFTSDLFSKEELKANAQLEELTIEAMRLIRDLSEELSTITKARHNVKGYENTLIEGVAEDYERLFIETDKILQSAEEVSDTLQSMANSLQPIACERYFKRLKYRDIVKEAQEIADSFGVYDNNSLYSEENFIDKLSQFFESIKAVQLLGRYQNDYYSLSLNAILPTTFKDLTEEGLKDFIRETIEPCFSIHLETIKTLKQPAGETKAIIVDAVDRLYRALNITLENEEANSIPSTKRNPVNKMNWSTSLLSQKVWSGQLKKGEPEQLTLWNYEEQSTSIKKEVKSYVTATYTDKKEIIGIEDMTPEQEDIYNAIASEFKAGNRYVTNGMIHKTKNAGERADLTPKQDEEMTRFIESATMTRITIHNKDYADKTGKQDFVQLTDNLLNMARLDKVEINGKIIDSVWIIKEHPILNKYADAIGQGKDKDINLLKTGTKAPYSTMRLYLVREIEKMREGKRTQKRILYTTLFDYLKITDRHKKKRYLTEAEKMLKHWIRYKEKGESYIYSFEFEPDAIRIYLSNKEKYSTEASKNRKLALENR